MKEDNKLIEALKAKLQEHLANGYTLDEMNYKGFLDLRDKVDQLHALLHDPHEEDVEWLKEVNKLTDAIGLPVAMRWVLKMSGYDSVFDLLEGKDQPAPMGWEMPAELKKRWEGGQ